MQNHSIVESIKSLLSDYMYIYAISVANASSCSTFNKCDCCIKISPDMNVQTIKYLTNIA